MALLLLLKTLFQRLHQLVKAAHGFNLGLFLVAEVFFGHLFQPVAGDVDRFKNLVEAYVFQAFEGGGEGLVELVDVAFVFHHGDAGEVIERLDIVSGDTGRHAIEERQELAHRDGHLVGA